ncbi:NUDIX hydrolase [uncultured Tateyamaria sp.]|uniref:NUDIX hydrolase n=1 Tax=uncultured Tateyamaria sp. TaxID=455651 RepID=UPI0026095C19|nr:NUDIX hydrolase [uncultured Tateyamaria sp.]
MNRRMGQPPEAGRRYIVRQGAYAILPRDGAVLLTCQSDPDPDFQLPGGGIDPGESPLQALHREVFEETGWHIARPRRLGAFRRFVYMPEYTMWAEKLCHVYVAWPTLQISAPTEDNHLAVWMSPQDAALQLGNEGDQHFLSRYFSRSVP